MLFASVLARAGRNRNLFTGHFLVPIIEEAWLFWSQVGLARAEVRLAFYYIVRPCASQVDRILFAEELHLLEKWQTARMEVVPATLGRCNIV